MDHELKQRLIGAVVVTALCAIFIPMLFDDPVDNSGQLVSELSIPAPVGSGADTAGKLPSNAEQVLKSTDPEPLSTETAGDTIESTGAAEEAAEPDASQQKQGHSGESLYAESEGYTKEDAGAEEVVEPVDKQPQPRSKQAPAEQSFDSAQGKPLSTDAARAKQARDEAIAKEAAKIKKAAETVKPTAVTKDGASGVVSAKEAIRPAVKKPDKSAVSGFAREAPEGARAGIAQPDIEPPVAAKVEGAKAGALETTKQLNAAKSLAAAVAEAKKPEVAPKASPKLVRWYIQIGSFSKRENAMSLWDSLREQGLPASLDTVQTDKGTSYRLRVGPELDGKKAAAMKARLDKQNIKAILVSE
jgi:DedD protein